MKVTKDTVIGDVLDACPDTAQFFFEIGMHCLGCPCATAEPIEDACAVHGANADELVEKLNFHFEHEEKVFRSIGNGNFEAENEESHARFLEKLDDLKSIVIKYLPDNGENFSRYNMLNHLLAMETDMRNHMRVEEELFNPLVLSLLNGDDSEDDLSDDSEVLSQREKEILAAVAHGKTNKEIADDLFISINTVVTHRKNIARKTGINSIAGLTVYAILNHIVEISDF